MCFKRDLTECFICCTIDGKSDAERQMEMTVQSNSIGYPLLPLSHVYSCRCSTLHAHNKCLVSVYKCPSCRKYTRPNLYVSTSYDYWFASLFAYLKRDTRRIRKLYIIAAMYLFALLAILAVLSYYETTVNLYIPPKSWGALIVGVILCVPYGMSIFIMTDLATYFNRYWLYNSKTEKCYALEI